MYLTHGNHISPVHFISKCDTLFVTDKSFLGVSDVAAMSHPSRGSMAPYGLQVQLVAPTWPHKKLQPWFVGTSPERLFSPLLGNQDLGVCLLLSCIQPSVQRRAGEFGGCRGLPATRSPSSWSVNMLLLTRRNALQCFLKVVLSIFHGGGLV